MIKDDLIKNLVKSYSNTNDKILALLDNLSDILRNTK